MMPRLEVPVLLLAVVAGSFFWRIESNYFFPVVFVLVAFAFWCSPDPSDGSYP